MELGKTKQKGLWNRKLDRKVKNNIQMIYMPYKTKQIKIKTLNRIK